MFKRDKNSAKVIYQPTGFFMCTAFFGALVYFLQQAHSFGAVLLAFIQAIVWPGFVIYHALRFLGA